MRTGAAATGTSRRAALGALLACLPLAGCAAGEGTRSGAAGASAGGPTATSGKPTTPRTTPPTAPTPTVPSQNRHFAALERRYGARLGVYAVDTGSGAAVAYRAEERFAFCSTFKMPAVAAVLHAHPLHHLEKRIRYTAADVDSVSPVTEDHIATGMTIRELCDAAIRFSDGTAANLLMRDIGGPARLTAYLRGLGDTVSRMDSYEPELNSNPPKDPRDTTSPHAVAGVYRKLVLGDALPSDRRDLVRDWLTRSTVKAQRIRAGVPRRWKVAHKTGTGDYGRANDIAVVWPPSAAPLVIAIMSDRPGYDARPQDALIADAAERVTSALT